jgi:hypothetical protein
MQASRFVARVAPRVVAVRFASSAAGAALRRSALPTWAFVAASGAAGAAAMFGTTFADAAPAVDYKAVRKVGVWWGDGV